MEESKRTYSVRRVFNHLLGILAEKKLLGNKLRGFLHEIREVKLKNRRSIFIGDNVYFDNLGPERIEIGQGSFITSGVKILTRYIDTSNYSSSEYFRFFDGKVVVEENVFIGMNSIIAGPIKIGKGSIVGANSVVTKDIPPLSVVAGNPARLIKKLKEN